MQKVSFAIIDYSNFHFNLIYPFNIDAQQFKEAFEKAQAEMQAIMDDALAAGKNEA